MKKVLGYVLLFSTIWVLGAQPQSTGPTKMTFGENKPVPPPAVPEAPSSSIMLA
jgi:hypothetical protein